MKAKLELAISFMTSPEELLFALRAVEAEIEWSTRPDCSKARFIIKAGGSQ
jgi:hypothetical protein